MYLFLLLIALLNPLFLSAPSLASARSLSSISLKQASLPDPSDPNNPEPPEEDDNNNLKNFSGELTAAEVLPKVVFVVLDGVRWQEFFGGGLPEYLGANGNGRAVLRQELLPFLWSKLQPGKPQNSNGVAWNWQSLGNRFNKQNCSVSNSTHVSLPAYADLLSAVRQNKVIDNKFDGTLEQPTLLDVWWQKQLDATQLWVLTSWSYIARVVSQQKPHPFSSVNTGPQGEEVQLPPWENARYDSDTYLVLQKWLQNSQKQFRYLFVSFNDSDEWGHRNDYVSYLRAIKNQDEYIKGIMTTVESKAEYQNQTLYVITTDHGRGSSPRTWQNHNNNVSGSSEIWAVIAGPAKFTSFNNFSSKRGLDCNHINLSRFSANFVASQPSY